MIKTSAVIHFVLISIGSALSCKQSALVWNKYYRRIHQVGIGTQIRRATVKDAYMRNSVLNRIITVIQYLGVLKRGGGGGGGG